MGAITGISCVVSLVLSLLVFSGCQACRLWLAATPLRTILGGYITSLLFSFLFTFVSNLETLMFGERVQAGWFPEVTIAFLAAVGTAALIHRVCVTTCLIFSGIALYYINRISQKTYTNIAAAAVVTAHKKKKN